MRRNYSSKSIRKSSPGMKILSHPWVQVILGGGSLVISLLILISLVSFDSTDQSYNTYTDQGTVRNICGVPGAFISDQLFQAFGYGAYLVPFFFGIIGYVKIIKAPVTLKIVRVPGAFITIMVSSMATCLILSETYPVDESLSGGWVGLFLVKLIHNYFTRYEILFIGFVLIFLSTLMWGGSYSIRVPVSIGRFIISFISWLGVQVKVSIGLIVELVNILEPVRWWRWKTSGRKKVYVNGHIKVEKKKKPGRRKQKEESKLSSRVSAADLGNDETRGKYQYPSLSLLKDPKPELQKDQDKDLEKNSEILESKLKEFGVEGCITQVLPGPVVTQYEFEPASGIKLNKIINLSEDLALALKTNFIPRVAHIPGKSVVGVEIPNRHRKIVYIKDLVSSQEFQNHDGKLKIALGKSTRGLPYITNLESMPHLLVAGATGSGKSVCINSILISFLYSLSPDELQLLLIDPKMLELSVYNGIPHLRESVITEPKKAAMALEWAVKEMEDRYNMLALSGVRNIEQYNLLVKENGVKPSDDGTPPKLLPHLVVIIDELADLMMVASASVENSIARLAQMARAAGIHLILATQRPSVDVLTGFIKANLPCRIAFQVSSKVDSRTILDMNGAEKLLGKGDMLFIPPGTSREKRVHGAYVSESEIKLVVEYLKKFTPREQQESIFKIHQAKTTQNIDSDPLYREAVEIVVTSGQASISMLQRRLRVGHSRAARLIDMMEQEGIVGPFEGSKPREILIQKEDLEELLNVVKT